MMERTRKIALAVTTGALLGSSVVLGVAWRRSFQAAWDAFQTPSLVEPALPRPGSSGESPAVVDLGDELDQQLARDYREAGHGDAVAADLELADVLPSDLSIPITRRALRFVRFFTKDPRGRASLEVMIRRSGRFHVGIEHALREGGLPADLLWLAAVESLFDPTAKSPKGAVGVWQFMPATARDYGLVVDPWLDERRDVRRATEAAVLFLRDLTEEMGRLDLALAAYNAGRLRVLSAVDELGRRRAERGESPGPIGVADLAREGLLPRETADYVPKITAVAIIASNRERFKLTQLPLDEAIHDSPLLVPGGTKLATIARASGLSVEELRRHNPELLRERVPGGSDVEVRVPADRLDHTLVTLPVYLEEDARGQAEPTAPPEVPGPQVARTEAGETIVPSTPVLLARIEALKNPLQAPQERGMVFDIPAIGDDGGAGTRDPLALWSARTATPLVMVGEGDDRGELAKGRNEKALEAALLGPAKPESIPVGSGIELRVRRDATAPRIAITVRVGEGDGALRIAEVVDEEDLTVGLSFALGKLAIEHAAAAPEPVAAVRARLNRHRRVALENHPGGLAWVALSDIVFPPGHDGFGRLVDPRGPDAAWWRDRILLDQLAEERRSDAIVVEVRGDVQASLVAPEVKALVGQLGLDQEGHVPLPVSLSLRRRTVLPGPDRLLVGWRTPGMRERVHPAVEVALEIVGGQKKSKIAARMKDDLVHWRVKMDADPLAGVAALELVPRKEVGTPLLESSLEAALTELATDGPTRVELAYAKAMLQIRAKRQAEREGRDAASPHRILVDRAGLSLSDRLAALEAVDADDIRRVVRTHLASDSRFVVVVQPGGPRGFDGEVARR